MVLTIGDGDRLNLEGESLKLDELPQLLAKRASEIRSKNLDPAKDVKMIVRAENLLPAGRAIQVINACRDAGFDSRWVSDAASAFDMAESWRPDLITLDLEMPGVDGVDLLGLIRSHPQMCGIPVVVISVLARGAYDAGLLHGAQAVFEKPLKFDKLIGKLQRLTAEPVSVCRGSKPVFEPYSEVPSVN